MAQSESPFAALGLREALVRTLVTLGYEAPTPIQERTIPLLLAGRNVIGQAQTGTGKTAAFALPILEKVDPDQRHTQALVLTPTRELAMQVAEALHSYAHLMRDLVVLPVYGGAPIVHQLKRLERGVHIVVGTPGRLIDHLDRKTLKLDRIRMIVLDEADEMLKMGFIDDVERILREAPKERQIALFSATMPAEVVRIAERHMPDAERVAIEHKTGVSAPGIEQRFLNVSEGQKLEALTQVLELEEHDAVLIFRRTKNGAGELAERLEGRGFAAVAMHGDMKQSERESVIRRLRAGQIDIVVATDVAARGLDVEQITHVVNYDIPYDVEAYVHRIGRTGRAGRSGVATLFITPRERRMMREIERFTGTPIKPMRMPTRADVAARRSAALKDTLRKAIEQGELELYVELVEQLAEEGPHDMAEIAAAAARLASAERPIAQEAAARAAAPPAAEPARERPARREPPPADRQPDEGDRDDSPTARRAPRADDESKVRLTMQVGKRDGIRPADVVGSIANEADVPGHEIGPIDIREEVTYVTIPAHFVDQVLEKVRRAKFRGRAVNLRVAHADEGADRPRREPFQSRGGFGKPSFTPRTREGGYRRESSRDDRPSARPERSGGGYARPERSGGGYPRPERSGGGYARPERSGPGRYAGADRGRPDRPAGPRGRADRPPAARGARPSYGKPGRTERDSSGPPPRGGAFNRFARPTAGKKGPGGKPGKKRW